MSLKTSERERLLEMAYVFLLGVAEKLEFPGHVCVPLEFNSGLSTISI